MPEHTSPATCFNTCILNSSNRSNKDLSISRIYTSSRRMDVDMEVDMDLEDMIVQRRRDRRGRGEGGSERRGDSKMDGHGSRNFKVRLSHLCWLLTLDHRPIGGAAWEVAARSLRRPGRPREAQQWQRRRTPPLPTEPADDALQPEPNDDPCPVPCRCWRRWWLP